MSFVDSCTTEDPVVAFEERAGKIEHNSPWSLIPLLLFIIGTMFKGLLLGSTERSISVRTRAGRNIKNVSDDEPDHAHVRKYQRLLRKHRGWLERKPATGGYNCVGHVFASRRTGIFDDLEQQLRLIFEDDGYRIIDPQRTILQPGDLVTYWMEGQPQSTFLHVGMILEMKESITKESPKIPWVLSKLDAGSGEVIHHF